MAREALEEEVGMQQYSKAAWPKVSKVLPLACVRAPMHVYVRACVHTRTQGHADARKHNVHKCTYVRTCMRENLPSII